MFRFAHPWLMLLLVPLGLAAWFVLARRLKQAMLFAPTHRLPHSLTTWRTVARLIMPYAFLLGSALLVIALARPQTVFSRITRRSDAIAIMMVVDVSGSMEALDFSPPGRYVTRLDVAKEECARFIEKRPGDMIGLVSFGGYAATLTPLTIDHAALLHTLKGVEVPAQSLNEQGRLANQEEFLTAIGDALATACGRLESAQLKSRIAILLSDGESNTGIIKPESAIELAKTLGVKVYTIGIGSNARAPFRARDVFGRTVIQYAQVTMDEELLKQIADSTGGRFYHITDPKGMEKALLDIDKLEKTKIEQELFERQDELFAFFLLPGSILILLAATVNTAVSRYVV